MNVIDTIKEVFEPTFTAVGDSDMGYDQKRAVLYNLYCFAAAVCPEYAAQPSSTLFEYGCCFLTEPERHPEYEANKSAFTRTAASSELLPGGGRWYTRRGKDFIKYDFGSPLFGKMLTAGIIPPQDRAPIPMLSLYAAVYLCCDLFKQLRPLWYVYFFYLDATNEPVDEEFDGKLNELLHSDVVYAAALDVRGSMLIGDEAELGAGKLCDFYKPFIDYRRTHFSDAFERHMNAGDHGFVAEYSGEMLKLYPTSAELMNWNAASRTELVIKSRDASLLPALIADLTEYAEHCDSAVVKKYLTLATLMKRNIDSGAV